MLRSGKSFLLLLTVFFFTGCSSTDDGDVQQALENVLDKASVVLSGLDQHVVTYTNDNSGAAHSDVYCAAPMLGDKNGINGTWSVAGNNLTVNDTTTPANTQTYQTTNATLVKGTSYATTTGENFTVTKIAVTICL